MPTYAEQLAQQMGTGAVGGIMGQIFGAWNDERQLRQQKDLQGIQIAGNKEMMDYSMMKQMEMWRNTNYKAQLEQMKMAGLSPGLIYGMKGGGGVTTGSPSGQVSGGEAPKGGQEQIQAMGLLQQGALTDAQRRNIEADTKLKEVEATKKEGVDSGLIRTEIMKGFAEIDNIRAKTILTNIEQELNQLDVNLKGRTLEDAVRAFGWNAAKIMEEMDQAKFKTQVDEATWNTKIKQAQADLIGTFLKNAMTKVQTTKTETEIGAIIRDGVQKWQALEIARQNASTQERSAAHQQWINDVQKSTQIPMEILEQAVDGMLKHK